MSQQDKRKKMPNVNKAIVMGVLGRDPETKQFPNGGSVTTFSVATSEFLQVSVKRLQNGIESPLATV